MMFMKAAPNSHGFVGPRHLGEMWQDQFDWVYRECDCAVFTMTLHPDVSGKPQSASSQLTDAFADLIKTAVAEQLGPPGRRRSRDR